jgi:hypothetical protein
VVLEALEAVPSRVANRALVSLFNPSFIPHMIGFKFSLYGGRGAASPPESLYNMCGLLLSQDSVSLEQVLPHLVRDRQYARTTARPHDHTTARCHEHAAHNSV